MDRGTETDLLSTIHCRMHKLIDTYETDDDVISNCALYGPSTANKIERWWRELHHRLETIFKEQLSELVSNGDYDQTSQIDRCIELPYLGELLNHWREFLTLSLPELFHQYFHSQNCDLHQVHFEMK